MARELLWRATGKEEKRQSPQYVMRFWDTRSTIKRNGSLLIHWIRFKKGRTRRQQSIPAEREQRKPEVNKQVQRSIRTDKRECVEDLTMTAEKAAREGNMKQPYDTTKKHSGNHRKPERPMKIKEGKVITNIEEQRNRWVEHFKKLLN
ncbi:unnamed protein product [Schistosoma mattheei]|uniref:Uncharacterized protein n=1 Tax=Schistosoma mattheei TaxID=31246 RepID=A0A183P962_9TREM|nr:unnamed protein product [Schistosoma mattheei]